MEEMDPFEARLLFGNMLDNLTGAQPTIDRVSGFAIKHVGMADDLLECIAEKLDKLQVPPRLNIVLVVDRIVNSGSSRSGTAAAAAAQTWRGLVVKDVERIVQSAIPETAGGDSNVPQVRKIVAGWRRKEVFDRATMARIEKLLEARAGGSSAGAGAADAGMKNQDILKRIEEDRERHKRHKEDAWIRPAYEQPADELAAYWETASDFNDADWQELAMDDAEYQQSRELAA
ncbi:hypothetical protein H4R19_000202 [Coemansia spiralis]|nr:hypothetical protein H4R19_000202 [Coemansia spiralis]